MENSLLKTVKRKKKRVLRIRKKIIGTPQRPRICVSKSNMHLTVQVIDDSVGLTLVSATSLSKDFKASGSGRMDIAKKLGTLVGKKCEEKGIKHAVLDRRGNKYHGLVAQVADSARESGLKF